MELFAAGVFVAAIMAHCVAAPGHIAHWGFTNRTELGT